MDDTLNTKAETSDKVDDPKNGDLWNPKPNSQLKLVFEDPEKPDAIYLTIIQDDPSVTPKDDIFSKIVFTIKVGTPDGEKTISPTDKPGQVQYAVSYFNVM